MLIVGYSRQQAAQPAPAGPRVVRMTAYSDSASGTSSTLQIPAGVASGNTLIAAMRMSNGTGAVPNVTGVPAGWSLVGSDTSSTGFFVYRRTADGTEGGTTVAWTTNIGLHCAFVCAEISGNRTVEVAFAPTSINPPSHTPTGGPAGTAWLAIMGCRRGDNDVTAPPADYGGLVTAVSDLNSHASNVRIAGAYRVLAAASEDPGGFTTTGTVSAGPQAATVSLR